MKWHRYLLFGLIVLLLTSFVTAYEKVIEFDDNEDIIISTTVYNTTGHLCLDCTCNLSVFNPYPNDNSINISLIMSSQNNGIFSSNLEQNLSYSQYIYPLGIVCNDSSGFFGGDTREGIKVSETVFDYSTIMLPVIAVAFGLLWFGFKIDSKYVGMKRVTIFGSLAFFFGAITLGWATMMKAPGYADFQTMMIVIITAFLMIILSIMYLWFKEEITEAIKSIIGKKY